MQRLVRKNTHGKGFTLIELLIVISIIALLMSILIPVIARAKEQAKRAFCLHSLGQLTVAWNMYAEENKDRIVNAQIWKCNCDWPIPYGDGPSGGPYGYTKDTERMYLGQKSWAHWPHQWNTSTPPSAGSLDPPHGPVTPKPLGYCAPYAITENAATEADWQHGIACGGLWKYVRDFKLYRCPNTEKKAYISYTVSMFLNGHYSNMWCDADGSGVRPFRNRSVIKNTAQRLLFIDAGQVFGGSWDIAIVRSVQGGPCTPGYFGWVSNPPMRHGKGTTMSFVDGHCEYRKWVDPDTLKGNTECNQNCNKDIFYMQKLVCGRLGTQELAAIPADCKIE
jgi:prepilin-type N-terminal cleavage/methylation domain-containing protein/prepilin-type processing-associated H-X9-DG protein